jgi:hypothetical protein
MHSYNKRVLTINTFIIIDIFSFHKNVAINVMNEHIKILLFTLNYFWIIGFSFNTD